MNKDELLEKIVKLEYQMFEQLKTNNEECKRKNTFFLMRKARFYPLSEKTLNMYLEDLKEAEVRGENPLLMKYRCMEMGIFRAGEMIEDIVKIESEWMAELMKKYPHVFAKRIEDFERYLRCELLTFSVETLKGYYGDVRNMKRMGVNMAELSYEYLFRKMGYGSIREVNESREKGLNSGVI
ncbi:hypothetical protein AciM339_0878 [Aciduliprofundum sp. MAR08-339]|nr:hypothetical protein AciM339_0878 [Aciduliprofundum sp. MAR08-339]